MPRGPGIEAALHDCADLPDCIPLTRGATSSSPVPVERSGPFEFGTTLPSRWAYQESSRPSFHNVATPTHI